jgi:hypothetical protein
MEADTQVSVRLTDYIFRTSESYPFSEPVFRFIFGTVVSAFLFIFGTIGNVIIIIIITFNRDMRNVPNMYINNLALSDIIYLTVLFLQSLTIRFPVTWISDEIFCVIFSFCYQMSVSLTAYSVAVLSIQRYRITAYPLQVFTSSQPTWRRTGATICGLWIVSALLAIPTVRSMFHCRFSKFLFITNYYQHLAIFHLLVSCVLPLCVIAFSYIMTARHLVKSSRSVPGEIQNPQQITRKITANVVLGLTVVFVISYLPFHIAETYLYSRFNLVNIFALVLDESDWLVNTLDTVKVLRYILALNSCLNPVALFCTSCAFRMHLKRYLTCCCKTKFTPTVLDLTRRN